MVDEASASAGGEGGEDMAFNDEPGWFRRCVVPGLVFKAAVIGPAYATGRELAEFFGPHGPWGGLAAMLLVAVLWSLTFAVSLEFARLTGSYDYKTFFRALIGPFSIVVELLMIALTVLIVSVVGAATGEMLNTLFGVDSRIGIIALALAVVGLTMLGNERIEAFLSGWSLVLYASYAVFLCLALLSFGDRIGQAFGHWRPFEPTAALGDGLRYGGYNVAAITLVLFTARNVRSRRDALIAGALGGPLAMLPGVLFFIAMMGYPAATAEVLPVSYLMGKIGIPLLPNVYLLIILVTLVGVAATVLHSLNERVAAAFYARRRAFPSSVRLATSVAFLTVGLAGAAAFGLVDLVSRGYGLITFGFIAFFIAPILTIGPWRIWSSRANSRGDTEAGSGARPTPTA